VSGTLRITAPVATNDWLPPRVALRAVVADTGVRVFERAGFRQVVTPVFEDTALFARTSGESSDVVTKEMYTFEDRGGRSLTLRPEGTAPVVRAFLEHGLARQPLPAKLWYLAPMYRYSRAQRGRYREHYQFGVEVLGSDDPAIDAEVIALQGQWYGELGLTGLTLLLNSIGDRSCRPAYRERLLAYLDRHLDELSAESRARRDLNPMRIFDSKDEGDQALMAGAPRITEHLCDACRDHFEAVQAFLDARGIAYEIDPGLVRGLDYYERTAWEWQDPEIGAQSAVSGGGRYDGLAEEIGGERTPGVGFGCGVERVVLALEDRGATLPEASTDVFLVIDEPAARPRLHAALDELRAAGVAAEADLAGRSRKGQLRQASRLRARVVGVCGPEEWERGAVRVDDGEVGIDGLVDELRRRLETA
jgi:histidyl-tRNA synthetase